MSPPAPGYDRAVKVARSVQLGVRWLRHAAQRIDESRAIAISISALVAAERNPHAHIVEKLVRDLKERQLPNGSWSDELWDTTWAVQALLDTGSAYASAEIQRAIGFLKATQDPVDGTWYEEPFETMLVLGLLQRLDKDAFAAYSAAAVSWLESLQQPDGILVGTRYTGMAASLFARLSPDSVDAPIVRRAVAALRQTLAERGIWTSASWSNFYALAALLDVGLDHEEPSVAQAVDWFLDKQEPTGRWMQVSEIHDTSMAVIVLARLLTLPIVDISRPEVAVIHIARENGTLRVDFAPPGIGAIVPSERMKLSDSVRQSLGDNQRRVLSALGRMRSTRIPVVKRVGELSPSEELLRAGQYSYGHLIPPRIQTVLESSTADHLRLDVDERLVDLPWELIHDGRDFLCLRYAAGRRIVSDQSTPALARDTRPPRKTALVVANPTDDLPAAEQEGRVIARLLREECGLAVDYFRGDEISKTDFLLALRDYNLIHFAGHADHNRDNPDESCLLLHDGAIQAFEIARFLKDPTPSVVFLNACLSAEEAFDPESYSPMMRGLGRTFLYGGVTAFLGYLVPIPDKSATRFATAFYGNLASGRSVGESVRQARIAGREHDALDDLTWASAVLYGEPSAVVFDSAVTA